MYMTINDHLAICKIINKNIIKQIIKRLSNIMDSSGAWTILQGR